MECCSEYSLTLCLMHQDFNEYPCVYTKCRTWFLFWWERYNFCIRLQAERNVSPTLHISSHHQAVMWFKHKWVQQLTHMCLELCSPQSAGFSWEHHPSCRDRLWRLSPSLSTCWQFSSMHHARVCQHASTLSCSSLAPSLPHMFTAFISSHPTASSFPSVIIPFFFL